MKKMKSFIAILLSVLMLLGTVVFTSGCTNTPTEPTPTGETTGDSTDDTTGELKFDEQGNVIFENVNIKLATVVAGEDLATFQNLIARFNNEYDGKIYIEVESIAQGLYETQVANKISNNNNPPDLLMSHGKHHKNFADKNMILPFNEAMEASGITIDFAQYSEGLTNNRNLGATDGSIYSIAADAQSIIVVYNKKLLEEIGATVPTTRAELLDVCAKFKAKYGNAPIAWADNASDNTNFSEYTFATAILQNGGTIVNDEGRVDWYDNADNLAAVKNAIAAFRELYDNGYVKRNEGYSVGLSEFMNGERLFFFTAPWFLQGLVQNYASQMGVSEQELMEKYLGGASLAGWFAMGDNADKVCSNYIYGDSHCFAMSKTATDINKQAAIVEFIKWFTQTDSIAAKWAEAGHITSCMSTFNSQEYQSNAYVSNYIAAFYPEIDNFQVMPITKDANTVVTNLNSLYAGTITVESGYTDAADEQAIKNRQNEVNNTIDFFE